MSNFSRSSEFTYEEAVRIFGPTLSDAPKFLKEKYSMQVAEYVNTHKDLFDTYAKKDIVAEKLDSKKIYIIIEARSTLNTKGPVMEIDPDISGDIYKSNEDAVEALNRTYDRFIALNKELNLGLQIEWIKDNDTHELTLEVMNSQRKEDGSMIETTIRYRIKEVEYNG